MTAILGQRLGRHQPIANEDGTVAVAFNGEIYNCRALRERLGAAGHTIGTEGDAEVLVHRNSAQSSVVARSD